ncbi:MAG: 50S ribosomal protein L6 [Clostridia bacterium]|nr:50S ribosomal protein L6 [Clostridia bacterium]
MSRIGRLPITLPDGVTCEVNENIVTVTGPLGKLDRKIENRNINVAVEGNVVTVTRQNENKETKAAHGLYRALIQNMVVGVKDGFKKVIVANGVGYRIQKQGNKLVLNIGYSKPREITEIDGITLSCTDDNKITVSGIDKELVGQVASKIKAMRPVEPYHLYGLRYDTEVMVKKVVKKVGKK